MVKNPSKIKNKTKRAEIYAKYKAQKSKVKKVVKEERKRTAESLGDLAPPKLAPKTIENTRIADDSTVQPDDEEVLGDERDDEFAPYYDQGKKPKIMITTRPKCSRKLYDFIGDLMQMIPNAIYYPRGTLTVAQLTDYALSKEFTHMILLSEKDKVCNGMLVSHLPIGPTAFFKLSSFQPGKSIPGHGRPTSHIPELILNNFTTRLGRRTGRFLGSLFPHDPQLEGRQVVTFHNQRDFIFIRHHRYVYRQEKEKVRARLQELGPRFTLKMKWLQEGTFNTKFGEYEWMYRRKTMDIDRKKFNI